MTTIAPAVRTVLASVMVTRRMAPAGRPFRHRVFSLSRTGADTRRLTTAETFVTFEGVPEAAYTLVVQDIAEDNELLGPPVSVPCVVGVPVAPITLEYLASTGLSFRVA